MAAYPLFWLAAHVQINTHKVTIAALGVLLLLARAPPLSRRLRLRRQTWAWVLLAGWCVVLLAEPVYLKRQGAPKVSLGLPRLAVIVAPAPEAEWMTSLSAGACRPPDVPLYLLGRRNDVVIHASPLVYWFSDRDIISRYHEPHPGLTDTEPVQREILAAFRERGVLPLLVLEHRFADAQLDRTGAAFRERGVAVGARLLDEWVATHYESVGRYGPYEIMRPIAGWTPSDHFSSSTDR